MCVGVDRGYTLAAMRFVILDQVSYLTGTLIYEDSPSLECTLFP